MALPDATGHFDLDFQIRMFCSPLPDSDSIRSLFFQKLRDIGFVQTENSTTALTIRFKKRIYSYDFVIIDSLANDDFILKRNNNPNNGNTNHYEWSQLRTRFDQLYLFFGSLSEKGKRKIRESVLAKKKQNYNLPKDHQRTGTEIFLQEVNNYYDRRR